jgi:hypothetical protein
MGIFAWQTGAVAASDAILFPSKNFSDHADETVGISGTRTGDGVSYPNNTYAISCFKQRRECWVSYTEQIADWTP